MPVSEYYRNSVSYRATVATTEGTYQRAPASCWYAMGNAVVNKMLTAPSAVTVYLTWTISSGLWNTVRVPSQCFSFCDNGVLLHGALSTETTQTLAVVVLPGNTWLTMEVGDTVYYMLRQRAPRFIIPGPFEVSADGRSLQLQGNPKEAGFVAPAPSAHLLYLGRRGDHPAQLCVMENDPDRARASIFSVDSVSFVAATTQDPVYALQSYLIRDGIQQLWTQLTPWLAVGRLAMNASYIVGGVYYQWPYPVDQVGSVHLIVPTNTATTPPCPDAVYMLRAMARTDPNAATVDGINLLDGDRVLVNGDTIPIPHIVEWSVLHGLFTTVISVLPPNLLCVIESGGALFGNTAWWTVDGRVLQAYQMVVNRQHPKGKVEASLANNMDWNTPCNHAFVVLTRRSDGLYAATPAVLQSNIGNITPSGWMWTYPLSLEDGSDRFDGPSATDGLLGLPRSLNPSRDVDYACIRRRMGPRLVSDPRPPEYLRLNVDMGGPVVLRAFAWAVVMDEAYPTLTVHGSNDPAFYVDQNVDIPSASRIAAGFYSKNTHNLLNGTLLWKLCVDRVGSSWTQAELDAGTADIYLTRLASDPRYSQLKSTGQISGSTIYTGWEFAHEYPVQPVTYPAFRYYAFTISVGRLTGTSPFIIELQEFRPGIPASSHCKGSLLPAIGGGTTASIHRHRIGVWTQPSAEWCR